MRVGIDASRAFVDQPTGTERYSYEMITHILALSEAKKHEWILYTKSPIPNTILTQFSSVKNIVIRLPRLWTQVGLALRTWIDHIDMLWVPAHTLPVLRRPGINTVVTIHGIEYEWLPAYENRLQRWYLPWSTIYAVKTATKVIAVSEFTKKQLIERLGAEAEKIKVIHEGYSSQLNTFEGGVLKKFGLHDKKYIIFVGTVQPRKNLVRLIEAFSKLDIGNLHLVIAGKLGWMYDEVLAAPKRYRVEDKVMFTRYISDAERYTLLSYALFYVQSSITEGFGLPILEAWDAGLAVASSNGGALPEVGGSATVLFDPGSLDEISQAMKVLLKESTRKHYEVLGKQRLKQFGWRKAASSVLELFIRTA